jgi:hypothetical protein
MIGACFEAYECSQDEEWMQLANTCFDWYLGTNDQHAKLCDQASGGCRDGLQQDGVNENQGAESTLSYILSLLALYNLRGFTVNQRDKVGPELVGLAVDGSGMRLKSVDAL